MDKIEWFVPGANGDAPAAAGIPFLLIDRPEGQATISLYKPFFDATIIENRVGRLLRRRPGGDSMGRAVFGAVLTGHTKLLNSERDRFVHL